LIQINFTDHNLPEGIYSIRYTIGNIIKTVRLVIVK
jgi:hypothetical protein